MKFWTLFTISVLLVLGLLVWGVSHWHLTNMSNLIADRLMLLNELRRDAMEEYFHTAEAELRFWSISPDILAAQTDLSELWDHQGEAAQGFTAGLQDRYGHHDASWAAEAGVDDADDSAYGQIHQNLHPVARLFVSARGYYDFFLIDIDGTVLYSVEKEADFTANLNTGSLRDSHLAEVYRLALELDADQIAVSDLQAYGPSNNEPALFMALAMRDDTGAALGVIAFQLPTGKIIQIMNYNEGMGSTGETYLVGQDLLMRSNSRFSEESTILRQRVDTPTVAKGLAGESGFAYVQDYRDVPVLSAYSSLDLGPKRWAMMAEIDRQEVVTWAAGERPALAGALSFIFGLSLWSAWYWRGRQLPESGVGLSTLDSSDPELGLAAFDGALGGSGSMGD